MNSYIYILALVISVLRYLIFVILLLKLNQSIILLYIWRIQKSAITFASIFFLSIMNTACNLSQNLKTQEKLFLIVKIQILDWFPLLGKKPDKCLTYGVKKNLELITCWHLWHDYSAQFISVALLTLQKKNLATTPSLANICTPMMMNKILPTQYHNLGTTIHERISTEKNIRLVDYWQKQSYDTRSLHHIEIQWARYQWIRFCIFSYIFTCI